MADAARIQHVENMQVRQIDIHKGDLRWFVVTANGGKVSDGFKDREHAELHLAWRRNRAAAEDPED